MLRGMVPLAAAVAALATSQGVSCPGHTIISVGIANASNLGNVSVQVCALLGNSLVHSCMCIQFAIDCVRVNATRNWPQATLHRLCK
jgi:hypothetical protein